MGTNLYLQDLRLGSDEITRLRHTDLKNLLRRKKLCLVLDLDHTLLNSTRLLDLTPEELYLKNQTDPLQGTSVCQFVIMPERLTRFPISLFIFIQNLLLLVFIP